METGVLMRKLFILVCIFAGFILTSCSCKSEQCRQNNNQVVSERFIHKYGYDVSKEDWENNGYPGQAITTLRTGVTVNANYEDGRLHGTATYTYPHSETIQSAHLYEHGRLLKKIHYTLQGMPTKETVYLSPTRYKETIWYAYGTPLRIEEYEQGSLIDGEYYTRNNKMESRVIQGEGVRTIRNTSGELLSRETVQSGDISQRTEYYDRETPHFVTALKNGKLHGIRQQFAPGGEPLLVENWKDGLPHGVFTYFQNGAKYVETHFINGRKHGIERRYVDGERLVEESEWLDGKRHGPTILYLEGYNKMEWYFDNYRVTKEKYDELCDHERHIARMNRLSSRDIE